MDNLIKLSETIYRKTSAAPWFHHPTLSNGPSGSCALLRNQNSPWRCERYQMSRYWENVRNVYRRHFRILCHFKKKKNVRTHEKFLLVDGEKPPFSPSFLLTPVTSRFPHPRRSFVKKAPQPSPKSSPRAFFNFRLLDFSCSSPILLDGTFLKNLKKTIVLRWNPWGFQWWRVKWGFKWLIYICIYIYICQKVRNTFSETKTVPNQESNGKKKTTAFNPFFTQQHKKGNKNPSKIVPPSNPVTTRIYGIEKGKINSGYIWMDQWWKPKMRQKMWTFQRQLTC